MDTDALTHAQLLEERLTHLAREHEELSKVVAAQADHIDRLARAVQVLAKRLAEAREQGGSTPDADQRPPHW
jgi:uncharacterized coiled-coil protein SlyX